MSESLCLDVDISIDVHTILQIEFKVSHPFATVQWSEQ